MKNVLKEFGNVFYSIFEGLPFIEKAILIFWALCFTLFVFAYIRGVIAIAQHYISLRKSKPQKF
jgi:hypothetical protein